MPTILESVLAGRKTKIDKLYKDIGGLSKLILAQDTSFLYDDSNLINKTFITKLNKYISIYGSILHYGNTKSINEEDLITKRNKLKFQAQKMFIKTKLNCNWQKWETIKYFYNKKKVEKNIVVLAKKREKRIEQNRELSYEMTVIIIVRDL